MKPQISKTLYLLRHAKSSRDDPTLEDWQRPLAPRGRRAAKLVADHLRQRGIAPELVLCSTSVRTRQTLEPLEGSLSQSVVSYDEALYGADCDSLVSIVRDLPPDCSSAMLIGHNPGMWDLALFLSDEGPARDRVAQGFPTAALLTLRLPGSRWEAAGRGEAQINDFVVPRELEAS